MHLASFWKWEFLELTSGLFKHFKDQPISKFLSHYSAVPEPLPTSQEQQTTSKPWTPTPPAIICNTSACTDISQGWCLKHFNFLHFDLPVREPLLSGYPLFGSVTKGRANLHRCELHEPKWNETVLSLIDTVFAGLFGTSRPKQILWVCSVWGYTMTTNTIYIRPNQDS